MHKPIQYSRVPFPQFTDRHVISQTDNMTQLERVKVEIAVELGKTQFVLEDLLKLKPPATGVDLNDPAMTAEAENGGIRVWTERAPLMVLMASNRSYWNLIRSKSVAPPPTRRS